MIALICVLSGYVIGAMTASMLCASRTREIERQNTLCLQDNLRLQAENDKMQASLVRGLRTARAVHDRMVAATVDEKNIH